MSPRATEGGKHRHTQRNQSCDFSDRSRSVSDVVLLTFFGARAVKVPTAASIVDTHGVTLTFPLRIEGATAPHTGLCGNAVYLFHGEMA